MDKRTIIFFLALVAATILVNIVFERFNKERVTEWSSQQQAKKIEKANNLKKEINLQTAKSSDLPIVEIFSDKNGEHYLYSGIKSGDAVLTLSWGPEAPKKVYVKSQEYTLAFQPETNEHPIIYQKESNAKLQITNLPEYGKYDVQLISPSTKQEQPFQIVLGHLADGHLTFPIESLAKLESEINEKEMHVPTVSNSIILFKSGDTYLPAALYNQDEKTVVSLDEFSNMSNLVSKPARKISTAAPTSKTEKFYVIETPYQQLVFSNFGGALAEINLPFESKSDKESVVKEIEFDKEMVEQHPYNARFPAHGYYKPGSSPSGEYVSEGKLGGYYPLIRRDLIEKGNNKSVKIPPKSYALNIVSDYPETAELIYEVTSFDNNKIVFETAQAHRRITKTYTIDPELQGAPYCINLSIKIEGDGRGLWLTSGIPEVEWISGSPAPILKYRITRNQKADVEVIDLPKDSITASSIYPDWICNSNGFFGIIIDSLTEIDPGYKALFVSGTSVPSRLVEIGQEYQRFKADQMPGYMTLLPLKGSGGLMNFRIFAGPFADSVLKTVDKVYSNPSTGYNPDYIACQSFHGWFSFISEPFAKFLFILINFFHDMTGNWAISIILLTVALRIMLYPLNAWSTKSMLRMQQIAPDVQAIQEKYKKDPKKAQLEIMNLYRDRGVNPVSGCFPLLIQMPFLIGMFDLLKSTFELRGATFIPGWIDNLTAPDVLFSWSTPIFFIGNQFHLLPILTGVVMYVQQKMMSTAPKDPKLMTEQQKQQKMMGPMMAILFTVMFYNFPSGLNIYFLSSMILGIVQQVWTAKKMKKQTEAPVVTLKVKEGKQKS